MIGMCRHDGSPRSASENSTPLMCGICTSVITRSGASSRAIARACSPSDAMRTSHPSASKRRARTRRTCASSSASRIFARDMAAPRPARGASPPLPLTPALRNRPTGPRGSLGSQCCIRRARNSPPQPALTTRLLGPMGPGTAGTRSGFSQPGRMGVARPRQHPLRSIRVRCVGARVRSRDSRHSHGRRGEGGRWCP